MGALKHCPKQRKITEQTCISSFSCDAKFQMQRFSRTVVRKCATRALCSVPSRSYNFGRLDGKVIVVAGAGNPPAEGHGIGASTSLLLARHGAKVVSVSFEQLNVDTITKCIQDEVTAHKSFSFFLFSLPRFVFPSERATMAWDSLRTAPFPPTSRLLSKR